MIKFFRKIRYKLMSENKTGSYFKYAIGEILLVVIGILIALGINNWNEHQKDLATEQNIINNLHEEFSKNLQLINDMITNIEKVENASFKLMKYMNKDIDEATVKKVDSLIYWAIEHSAYNPSNNTYSEILNTGKIELIQQKSLKNKLFEWARELENNKDTFYIFEKWIEEGILPYLSKNIALKNIDVYSDLAWETQSEFESGVANILKDREFENIIDNNIYHIVKIKGEYLTLKRIIENIITETR